jgi:hypothetical protein
MAGSAVHLSEMTTLRPLGIPKITPSADLCSFLLCLQERHFAESGAAS